MMDIEVDSTGDLLAITNPETSEDFIEALEQESAKVLPLNANMGEIEVYEIYDRRRIFVQRRLLAVIDCILTEKLPFERVRDIVNSYIENSLIVTIH